MLQIRSHSSRSQGSSSGGQVNSFESEMAVCCTLVTFQADHEVKESLPKPNVQETHVFDEDQLLTGLKQPFGPSELNDIEDNHLQRSQERYSSYFHSLPLQLRWLKDTPYLGACFDCELVRNRMYIYGERWSECFQDIMKLRMANHVKFHEEELVQMLFEVLQGLRQLEEQASFLRVAGEGKVPLTGNQPSELLYLHPNNIAVIARKAQRSTSISFKITNFLDHILFNYPTKKKYLYETLYNTEESLYFYPPELLTQLFIAKQQVQPQHEIVSDFDFDEEEEVRLSNQPQEKDHLSCKFRGAIWSLGILILRCIHSKQGDYLHQAYGQSKLQGKLQFINDLLGLCKRTAQESIFNPFPVPSDETHSKFEKWITGSYQPVDEFSWALRDLIRQMLIYDPDRRPTVSMLLDNPLFYGYQVSTSSDHHSEPVSLGVFANLTKQDLNHQIADKFFSNEELVHLGKPILKRKLHKATSMVIQTQINISVLKSTFSTKINQICTIIRQEGVQKLQVDQFLERIARIASMQPASSRKPDEDQLSIKSEIVSSKRQSVQLPQQTSNDDSKASNQCYHHYLESPPQMQSNLSSGMLSKMNIFSRVLQQPKSKRSESPKGEQLDDSQSTFDTQIVPTSQLTQAVAQLLLMKLVASSSERLFRAFLGKCKEFMVMGVDGVFWREVRHQLWPRALFVENEEAQREVIDLTLEIGYCTLSLKWNDYLQIQKDIPRCHQGNSFANSYFGKLMISRTLSAFININSTNFYLQGMDAMVLVLLQAMNYDWQLAVICLQEFFNRKIVAPIKEIYAQVEHDHEQNSTVKRPTREEISDKVFKTAFNKKLQEKLVIYKWILNFQDPSFLQHLENIGFLPEMYVVSWFTNFFSMDFEVNSVIRIWDYLFLSEENFEVFFAVAIMCELRETLLLKDSSGILSCIKNLQSIISIDLCLKYALHMQSKLPKNLTMLHYTTAEVRKDLQETQNQFVKERPWETPPLYEQVRERRCFEISVGDLQSLQSKGEQQHPSYIMMLDFRILKSFESECVAGSIYANYLNGKINSPNLLKYLQLKNQVTGSIEQFKEEIEPQPIMLNKRSSPAHKSLGFVIIIWDYATQQQEVIKIQSLMLDVLNCKRLCVLKGGIQAVRVDADQMLIRKQIKSTLPLFIKKELEDFKML